MGKRHWFKLVQKTAEAQDETQDPWFSKCEAKPQCRDFYPRTSKFSAGGSWTYDNGNPFFFLGIKDFACLLFILHREKPKHVTSEPFPCKSAVLCNWSFISIVCANWRKLSWDIFWNSIIVIFQAQRISWEISFQPYWRWSIIWITIRFRSDILHPSPAFSTLIRQEMSYLQEQTHDIFSPCGRILI